MKHLALALILAVGTGAGAVAGPIEKACLKSPRDAASSSLCGCIQDAADLVLSSKDQSLAAKFFSDPHKAQEIRQSDRRSHETFWERYKAFGETAEAYCS